MKSVFLEPPCLNVCDDSGQFLCPACGFAGYFRGNSFDQHGGVIGTGICPCCLFEPGFNDVMAASGTAEATSHETVLVYRRRWISDGMKWRGDPKVCSVPHDWSAHAQLERLLAAAPELR